MGHSEYILYELACDGISMRISELSAQLADARNQRFADQALIDELKQRSSALWLERSALTWHDDIAVEACLLTYSRDPEGTRELIKEIKRQRFLGTSA